MSKISVGMGTVIIFRTFITQGILESSVKITNEPPTGMLANLHKALDNFNQVLHTYVLH